MVFSYCSAFSQWRKKDKLEILFNIEDFKNQPIQSAHITIETIDQKQNSRYGKHKHQESFNNHNQNEESNFTISLPSSRFENRKVLIRIMDMRNLGSCIKVYSQEFEALVDGQSFEIQLEIDKIAYKNRTTKVNFSGRIFSFINPPFEQYFKDIYKSSFSGEVFTEDLDKQITDTAIVTFTIDKNCNIVNREIQKKILGLRTDLENVILNSLEARLKEFNKKIMNVKRLK